MKRVSFFALALLVLAAIPSSATEPTNTFLIKGIPGDLKTQVERAGGSVLRVFPQIGYAVAVSSDPAFPASLTSVPGISNVDRDLVAQWTPHLTGQTMQSTGEEGLDYDPTTTFFYPCQWNMEQIHAPQAWEADAIGEGVTVAVLDSGVDPYHNELWGKVDMANSTSFLTPGSSPCNSVLNLPDEETFLDFRYHGTLVATQITGNGVDMASVAPGAEILAVKVNNCNGSGSFADLIAGILYAADLSHVDIINMSLGAYFPKNEVQGLIAAVNKAINYANSKGKLVVASAGNDGENLDKDSNYVHLPSQAGGAVSVYATNYYDELASYSNYGRSGTWVGAPGGGAAPPAPLPGCFTNPAGQGGVIGACTQFSVFFNCQGGNIYLSGAAGTSFAAPTAAGVAAILDGNYAGFLNGGQLKSALAQTADDLGRKGTDLFYSHGRVNAGEAAER